MEKDEVKFKEGDVVQLLSGSPAMTVIAVKNNDFVECIYYNYSTFSFSKHTFSLNALVHVGQ